MGPLEQIDGGPQVRWIMTALSERRKHHRLPAKIDVRYGTNGEYRMARACDISPAGIGLAVPVSFPVGTDIDLRFQGHGQAHGDLILLRARVRHSGEERMGLEFVNVPARERAYLVRLLDALLADLEPVAAR